MEATFKGYCSFGKRASDDVMENAQFVKMCRESELADRTQADLIWTRVMRKERKMRFEQFEEALKQLAELNKLSEADLKAKVKPPQTNKATEFADDDWVKRQTDTTLYTGAHKARFDEIK